MNGRRRLPRLLHRPEQGWSSLLLLMGMLVIVGASVADSRPLWLDPADGPVTDALVPLMACAVLVGYVLARSSLGVVRAHVIGATVAALLLLFVAGAALIEGASPLPTNLDAIGERVSAVWQRLDADMAGYLGDAATTPTVVTFLVLGAICWTTAQFGAFGVFRYDRAGPAVMASGAVLFLNVGLGSLTADAELLPVVPVLAAYTALAMLLLMRLQLSQQRKQWARRHIADTGEVSRLFLRSGVLFVAFAVLSASSLSVWATIDPQDIDMGGFEDTLEDVGEDVSRWLGLLVGVRPPETASLIPGDEWEVEESWQQPNGIAFRARLEDSQLRGNYWWGWAHDRFDGRRGWDRDKLASIEVEANELIPWQDLASAAGEHRAIVTITIEGESYVRGMAFRPAEAAFIDRDVIAFEVDDGGGIGDIEYRDALEPEDTVIVESFVRDYSEDGRSLTATALREAGEAYPAWVRDRYLQGTDISGARVDRAAARIRRTAPSEAPYDLAIAVQNELRGMTYRTDMAGVCDQDEPIPECVLREQLGFCQHYATTMTMLLRELGIPARIVTGYLPGNRVDGEWVVEQAAFHNWVEAYFPGYGWVRFDPTPRTGDEFGLLPTNLPEGPAEPPDPSPSAGQGDDQESPEPLPPEETPPPDEALVATPRDGGPAGMLPLLAGLAVVLAIALAGALVYRFRRLARADDGSLAYRGIVSLATRLGYGPHPSQTEYEYAGSLSETIPTVRDDLYLVTHARVETAYGQRALDPARRGVLRKAYGRIRMALLRLWLRLRR